jgi:hypothetical protein
VDVKYGLFGPKPQLQVFGKKMLTKAFAGIMTK